MGGGGNLGGNSLLRCEAKGLLLHLVVNHVSLDKSMVHRISLILCFMSFIW